MRNTIYAEQNKTEIDIDEPLSHPINIAELFTPYGVEATNVTLNYTEAGLSKLLVFNAYARAHSHNFTDFITREAKKYPYQRNLKVKVS